ncbi:hypothetical protein SLEP1_g53604 [Rubroshorea leprosula]|uniref:Uncharacterized protein n=1 Tax=Rubroshorea leprosula TaxID=152421 RepID=A0AAV5MC97_9ROSI|nr:hypothetical protein SLEP1_g53604 [Rubroshorea leprosula]
MDSNSKMAPLFPSPLERPVDSALLFLSTTPLSLSPLKLNSGAETSEDRKNSEEGLSVASIGSKSSSSYLTSDIPSKEVRPHKLSFVTVEPSCHELMKLKGSMSTRASCLSSSSSAISSAQSKHFAGVEKKPTANLEKLRKKARHLKSNAQPR